MEQIIANSRGKRSNTRTTRFLIFIKRSNPSIGRNRRGTFVFFSMVMEKILKASRRYYHRNLRPLQMKYAYWLSLNLISQQYGTAKKNQHGCISKSITCRLISWLQMLKILYVFVKNFGVKKIYSVVLCDLSCLTFYSCINMVT